MIFGLNKKHEIKVIFSDRTMHGIFAKIGGVKSISSSIFFTIIGVFSIQFYLTELQLMKMTIQYYENLQCFIFELRDTIYII